MPRPKSSKIFIKNGADVRPLLWATVGPDGSVMMGFPWSSTESIELVMDKELGNLKKEEIFCTEYAGSSKISFHPSGHYKLSCMTGRTATKIARTTVIGPPLTEITTPRRMAELLLAENIPPSEYRPSGIDIVLDITGSDSAPTRCTIGCMSKPEFEKHRNVDGAFVDTSACEAWNALESDSHTWVWVLRRSRSDTLLPKKFYVTLLGDPMWPA